MNKEIEREIMTQEANQITKVSGSGGGGMEVGESREYSTRDPCKFGRACNINERDGIRCKIRKTTISFDFDISEWYWFGSVKGHMLLYCRPCRLSSPVVLVPLDRMQ